MPDSWSHVPAAAWLLAGTAGAAAGALLVAFLRAAVSTFRHVPVSEDPPASVADRVMGLEREVSSLRFEWQAAAEHLTSLGEAAESRRKRIAATESRRPETPVAAEAAPLTREDEIELARARLRGARKGA